MSRHWKLDQKKQTNEQTKSFQDISLKLNLHPIFFLVLARDLI